MRPVLILLAGLVAAVVTVGLIAPAQWLAFAVQRAAQGRLELADCQGTLWDGSAVVVLRTGDDSRPISASLPERLHWQLRALPLLVGHVELSVQHPSALEQGLHIHASPNGQVEISAMHAHLPASLLIGLGAPWNTIRPGGAVEIVWGGLTVQPSQGIKSQGEAYARWRQASSAMTSVAPFGDYQLDTNGVYPGTLMNLHTLSGPLDLHGDGTIQGPGRMQFQGQACPAVSADATARAQLNGFISLLGRREGDCALLHIGS